MPTTKKENVARVARQECGTAVLKQPGQPPRAVLNLAVGVGLGKTEQAFEIIKYVADEARVLLKADADANEVDKLWSPTTGDYRRQRHVDCL